MEIYAVNAFNEKVFIDRTKLSEEEIKLRKKI